MSNTNGGKTDENRKKKEKRVSFSYLYNIWNKTLAQEQSHFIL